MPRSRRVVALALVLSCITLAAALWISTAGHRAEASGLPSHHRPGGFRNLDPEFRHGLSLARVRHFARRLGPMLRGEPAGPPLTLAVADVAELRANRERPTVTWVGHSTFLVQLDGVNFLTDPNWSTRSGPFGGLVGVGRYTPPGLAFEDLPRVDFVVISHDHYDHLDEPTVRRLAATFSAWPCWSAPPGSGWATPWPTRRSGS